MRTDVSELILELDTGRRGTPKAHASIYVAGEKMKSSIYHIFG